MAAPRALGVLLLVPFAPLPAQSWNTPAAETLVARAVERRRSEVATGGLGDYRARAHGFVFFLGQLGEGLAEPPRLIKTDQLELEVYWKAPGASKQRIIGWRDRRDLPTDINYHRDHLGIVQNGFADRIRLGDGHEVRDVPHPLSPAGGALYDFAVVDSLTIELPERAVRVYEVLTRPRDFRAPRVVGALYLDVETAELVRFRFNFTRSAYRDPSLEDITIVLDNGLWDSRHWLPRRQEIEIRRRTEWLELPARGIIRGRWEISGYAFNLGLGDSLFRGPEIVAAPRAVRDTFPWAQPLAAAIGALPGTEMMLEVERVRAAVAALAGGHALTGLAAARPALGSLSDLAHFNRVEGLALGAGYVIRPGAAVEMRAWAGYGFGDGRAKLRVETVGRRGPAWLRLRAGREVRDVGDDPVISPLVNSLSAQEGGADYGDYVLRERVSLALGRTLRGGGGVTLEAAAERTTDAAAAGAPAWGAFRPNPPLGSGTMGVAALTAEWRRGDFTSGRSRAAHGTLESGVRDGGGYVRLRGGVEAALPLGRSMLVTAGWGGWGSGDLPPHRAFVLGGRGSLPGEPFRAFWGRRAALATLEWRLPVPFPAIPLGPFVSTGNGAVVAPFLAVGWVDDDRSTPPWRSSSGARPVAGLAAEFFHRLIRAEVGVGLRDGGVGVAVDARRDLWPIL